MRGRAIADEAIGSPFVVDWGVAVISPLLPRNSCDLKTSHFFKNFEAFAGGFTLHFFPEGFQRTYAELVDSFLLLLESPVYSLGPPLRMPHVVVGLYRHLDEAGLTTLSRALLFSVVLLRLRRNFRTGLFPCRWGIGCPFSS